MAYTREEITSLKEQLNDLSRAYSTPIKYVPLLRAAIEVIEQLEKESPIPQPQQKKHSYPLKFI